MSLMIDWVSAKEVPFHYPDIISGGSFLSVDPQGEIEYTALKRLGVRGSYESNMVFRTSQCNDQGHTTHIEISGCPAKWLQGHNIFGSGDLNGLISAVHSRLANFLNSPQPEWIKLQVSKGNYDLTRVDINGMFSLGSRENVLTWLNRCETTGRTRMGTGVLKGTSVYFGQKSEYWTLVFYSKGQEIEVPKHQLPRELTTNNALSEFADDKLRAELRLKAKQLKALNLRRGADWIDYDIEHIFFEYLGRLTMAEQKTTDTLFTELPRNVRGSYRLWLDGYDVRQHVPRATFYRHRKSLLEFGVDISVPCRDEPTPSNVVPFVRVLKPELVTEIPKWAQGTDYYFEPDKHYG